MSHRVLLVDDEADIREVAAVSLRHVAGWDVRTVSGGAEALAEVLADPPEAIILDAMMPGMDGAATLRALRSSEATARIPVVMLTAKTQSADLDALWALGIKGVVAKPFDPMTLGTQLATVLGWSV